MTISLAAVYPLEKMRACVCLVFLVPLAIDFAATERTRRALIFTKNSKLFFRLNGKDNVIPWVQVFAHGFAIRVNYDLPESLPKRHAFFKRSLHEDLAMFDTLMHFKLFSCTMRDLCGFFRTSLAGTRCQFFCQIAQIFARSKDGYVDFFYKFVENCDRYRDVCENGNKTQSTWVV